MPYRLAASVRVRKEAWGLLFYRSDRHKVCFVRSGDWLSPAHFNGTWTDERIIDDITGRTGVPAADIERKLPVLTARLVSRGMIAHEVR